MKENNKLYLTQELELKHPNYFCSHSSKAKPSLFNKKNEELASNKCYLESMLTLIKNCQIDYINKTANNKSLFIIKKILLLLKDDLNLIYNKKYKKYENLKNKNDIQKKEIQNLIFPSSDETEEKIKKNTKNIDNSENSENGRNEINFPSEIKELKFLNFQMENEIKNTNFLIDQKNQIYTSIKSNIPLNNEDKEIYLNNNYINILKVSYILKNNLKEKRTTFIDTVNDVSEKETKIKFISDKIADLKFKIEKNENNNSQIIITELSKEYIKSEAITDESIMLNKSTTKRKEKKIRSNKLINKNMIFINPEKFKRKKIIYSKTLSPKIINNISNNIKNCLIKYNANNINNLNSNDDIKNNNEKYKEKTLHSFNSSIDSNSLSCTFNNKKIIEELELMENAKINNKLLYLSDDNSNTENSNNSSNRNNYIYNYHNNNLINQNENEKQNQDDNYIFTNMSDNDEERNI